MISRDPVSLLCPRARSLAIPTDKHRRLQQIVSQYSKQIEDLSQREFYPNIVQSINNIFNFVFDSSNQNQENWRAQLTVEDMCIGELSGCDFAYALEQIQKALSDMKPTQPNLEYALAYASYIQDKLQSPIIAHHTIAEEVREKVANLSIHETICLPVSNSEHAMLLSITCTNIGRNGKKIFSISHHNTGDGLDYHYKKIDKNGNRRYQTDYALENITEQTLCSTDSTFFQSIFSSPTIPDLYKKIFSALKGKKAKPKQDLRYWNHEQIGDSCSSSCVRVFLRTQMRDDDYKIFRFISRIKLLLASYNDILNGKSDSSTQKRITLEMIHRLNRTCLKQHLEPPSGLDFMEIRLISTEKNSRMSSISAARFSFLDNVQLAYKQLTKYIVDPSCLDSATSNIHEALKKKAHKASIAEIDTLTAEITTIHQAFQEIPLTERQRYLMTALEATIQKYLHQSQTHRKKSDSDSFFQRMISKFNTLKLHQKSLREGYGVPAFYQVIKKCT